MAFNLANQLGIAPGEIHEYLVKREGDPVRKDDVIAENKPFIKWFKTEVRSPITGRGIDLYRSPDRSCSGSRRVDRRPGYVDGTIAEVHPQQGVTVETACSLVQGIFGIGGETSGEIMMAATSPDQTLAPDRLTAAMKGKVVVGGAFLSADDTGASTRGRGGGVSGGRDSR